MSVGQYEAVATRPQRVLGIESHELVEEDMCSWCQAHGRAGMAGVGFGGGIDLENEQRSV